MQANCPDPIRAALTALGVRRLAFGIHQSAFPAGIHDTGHGAPASASGLRLLSYASQLGFNILQLGPDGQITEENRSPYDGTAFARNTLQLDLATLALPGGQPLLSDADLDAIGAQAGVSRDPRRADFARARAMVGVGLARAQQAFTAIRARSPDAPAVMELAAFREQNADWLDADALFELHAGHAGHDDPALFDPAVQALLVGTEEAAQRRRTMRAVMAAQLEPFELGQWLAACQASSLRDRAHGLGLQVFGDMPIGWSHRDRFLRAPAFATRWLLGAPPSRTNPEGQAWGYPVLDPDQLDHPDSPARRLFERRIARSFGDQDGLRIDHPHGLVCPWIYPSTAPEPGRAVQAGTRAFESPDVPEDDLQRWAIATCADLDPEADNRWAEGWVRTYTPAQVARWSRLFDPLMATAERLGKRSAIAAEVLSTCPVPLRAVLQRHGLGRFRVVQKADVDDPTDVYRADAAQPADWVMLGNHDTPPIRAVIERWRREGRVEARAAYLAARLVRDPRGRDAAVRRWCAGGHGLANALLADLFLCPAENVMVYFTDLFGAREPFNRPGVVHPDNWSMRVSPDFEAQHRAACAAGEALDIRAALSLSLRARGGHEALARAIDDLTE